MLLERNLYCVWILRDCTSSCNRNVLLLALKLIFLNTEYYNWGEKEKDTKKKVRGSYFF